MSTTTNRVEARLRSLGVSLPEPASPIANYVPAVQTDRLLFVSGQVPMREGKIVYTGKVGGRVDVEMGQQAAQLCFINVLAQAKAALGSLDRVTRVIRLGGFVSCVPEFTLHAQVMNGASDMAVAVFDDAGRHARTTIGVPSLPGDAAVEVEAVFEVG